MSNSPSTPFSVQSYQCTRLISVGRSGDLFAATHEPSGAPYAVRRLSDEVLEDPEMAQTVLHNLQQMVGLSHPNIVTIHEILQPGDGSVFAVMELVQGVGLGTLLNHTRQQKQPLSSQLATHVALQICHALDQAHHLTTEGRPDPLVHGALWPPNVLISFDGDVRVTDFGAWVIPAAMQRDGGSASIRTQFSYRSPEHVNGDALTGATDIFCVGVLLYEMLTTRQLFLGGSLLETLELVESAQIGSLDDLPPALASVLERCLAQESASRYADVSGLISALSVAVPGAGTREVREELARVLEPLAPVVESKPQAPAPTPTPTPTPTVQAPPEPRVTPAPLAPEPLDDEEEGAEPLRPLPGLGHQDDEPTHINPSEVNEALAALSKDATDPGDPDALDDILTATDDDDEEPTRIDPIIPGITGPLPSHAASGDLADREGPTNIIPPEEAKVLFEGADPLIPVPGDDSGLEHDDATEPNGSQVLPFPSRLPHVGDVEETKETTRPDQPARKPGESTTAKAAYPEPDDDDDLDDEPTAPTSPELIKSLLPLPGGKATNGKPDFSAAKGQANEEEPTVPHSETSEQDEPTAPTKPHGDPVATDGGIGDDDEPTVQNRPRPGMTLLGVGKDAQAPRLNPAEPRQLGRPHGAAPLRPQAPQSPYVAPLPASATPSTPPTPVLETPDFPGAVEPAGPPTGYAPTLAAPGSPQPAPQPPQATLAPEAASLPPAPGEDAQLTFSPEVSEAGYSPEAISEFSTFDQDESLFSVTFDKPVRRFTAAHLLLLVAIIVFIVAVGLLARRLLSSGKGKGASVERVEDAGVEVGTAPAENKGPRSKPLPEDKSAGKKGAGKKGAGKATVHSSGKHFEDLLKTGKRGRPGVIKISSTPKGTVYLDRRRKGKTPYTTTGRPGAKLSIIIVAKGHQIYRKSLVIPKDRALVLDARLEEGYYPRATGRRKGWLSIRCSRRRRWRIALDGKDTGFICPVAFALKPGRYMVSFFNLFGDKVRKRRARITWGRRTRLWAPRR